MVILEMFLYINSSFLQRRIIPKSNSLHITIHNLQQSYSYGNSKGYQALENRAVLVEPHTPFDLWG